MNIDQTIVRLAQDTNQKNRTLILATGVFDVLHQEHRNFLGAAKAVGDVLIIGLETDRRVKVIKGVDRPVNNQETRKANLSAWHLANAVFILPEDFHLAHRREELIKLLRPKILAVSSHTEHLEEKARVMGLIGGEVRVVYQHNPETSTTKLLVRQNQQKA
jgi:cytidyltransferase-like protein